MCTMHHLPEAIQKKIYLPDTFYSWNGLFCHPKKCVFLSTAYRAAIVQLYAILDRNFVLLFRCNKIEENNVKSRLYHTLVVLLLCCKTLKLLSPTHIIILHYWDNTITAVIYQLNLRPTCWLKRKGCMKTLSKHWNRLNGTNFFRVSMNEWVIISDLH